MYLRAKIREKYRKIHDKKKIPHSKCPFWLHKNSNINFGPTIQKMFCSGYFFKTNFKRQLIIHITFNPLIACYVTITTKLAGTVIQNIAIAMVFTYLTFGEHTNHIHLPQTKSVYHLLNIIKHEITKTITAHKLPSPSAL